MKIFAVLFLFLLNISLALTQLTHSKCSHDTIPSQRPDGSKLNISQDSINNRNRVL
jgi:hypothetical protein